MSKTIEEIRSRIADVDGPDRGDRGSPDASSWAHEYAEDCAYLLALLEDVQATASADA